MHNVTLGTTLDGSETIVLNPSDLTRHMAYLGGTGSGKTTAALNVLEQNLMQGIPAIIVDRKGDLCGYGLSGAVPAAFHEKVETVIYTPGHKEGRTIGIQIVPEGVNELGEVERENAANSSAHALCDMLGYKHEGPGAERRVIVFKALELMLERGDKSITIPTLQAYINRQSPKFLDRIYPMDLGLLGKIVKDLSVFAMDKGRILAQKGEPLSMDNLLGRNPERKDKRTRLSIISTKFLGNAMDFWLAQLLIEASRWASKNPSPDLQALLFLDEADKYLPAVGAPATKAPTEDLLKRARSAGIGIMLATQSPGDLDYKGRDNIRTWFLGRIREQVALKKIHGVVQDDHLLHKIPDQTTGQFYVATEGHVEHVMSRASMLKTVQLPEGDILALAKQGPLTKKGEVRASSALH